MLAITYHKSALIDLLHQMCVSAPGDTPTMSREELISYLLDQCYTDRTYLQNCTLNQLQYAAQWYLTHTGRRTMCDLLQEAFRLQDKLLTV